MNEEKLIQDLIKREIPDLERVRKECLKSEPVRRKGKGKRKWAVAAVCCTVAAMVLLCRNITPVRIMAAEVLQQIGLVKISDEENVDVYIVRDAESEEADMLIVQEVEENVSDLVYVYTHEESVSVKAGQKMTITNIGTEEYKQVTIVKVGGGAEELGDLAVGKTLSIQVEEAGEYVIYAGEDEAVNITGELLIGYEAEVR